MWLTAMSYIIAEQKGNLHSFLCDIFSAHLSSGIYNLYALYVHLYRICASSLYEASIDGHSKASIRFLDFSNVNLLLIGIISLWISLCYACPVRNVDFSMFLRYHQNLKNRIIKPHEGGA